MSNLSSKGFIMHKKEFKFSDIVDQELFETVGQQMTGLSKALVITRHR
jgi:hypothetical protein